MILRVAYTGNDLDFLEDIKKVVEQYPLVKLEAFCKDQHLTQKDYYKLMNYYATGARRFMVLLDNDLNVVQPFYVEDKTCAPDYLKIVLDHWVLYNPIEDGHSGNQEET
jgi:hypothetical protein